METEIAPITELLKIKQDRTESPGLDGPPRQICPSEFLQRSKRNSVEENSIFKVAGAEAIGHPLGVVWEEGITLSHIIYKNKFKMDHGLEWKMGIYKTLRNKQRRKSLGPSAYT